tara:strand:+ start:8227 stop:8445 length:219 start_codon:yes stop_codon:yes gene_type:complete
MIRKRRKYTPSRTSPKGGRRGCLCADGKTYSSKCCDGSLEGQGIGNITRSFFFLYTEEGEKFIQEDNSKLFQ